MITFFFKSFEKSSHTYGLVGEGFFQQQTGKIRCIACVHRRRCGATYKTPATGKNTQMGKIHLVACDQRQLSCVAGEIAARR